MASSDAHNANTPGPKPETLKLEGDVDWKYALRHAMGKPKPEKQWREKDAEQPEKRSADEDKK